VADHRVDATREPEDHHPATSDLTPSSVRWQVFAFACGASFLLYLHRYSWNIVGPELQSDFGLTNTQAGFLFSLFYYTYALVQVPAGMLSDRIGPHAVVSVSIVAWSLAIAGIGWTSNLVLLAACRLLFGAAQAGCYPGLSRLSRLWFPVSRRTILQAWVSTTAGRAGGALSPVLLGSWLIAALDLSWHTALGVMGLVGVLYGLIFWGTIRSSPAEHPGVNPAERELIEFGSAPMARGQSSSLSARRAWRNRPLRVLAAQQFLDAGSDVAFVSLIGTYFLQAQGIDLAHAGWLASLPLWGGALGGALGGWLNDRLILETGSRRWSRSGVACTGKLIGCVMLALVVRQTSGAAAAWFLFAAKFFSDWSLPTTWGTCTDLGGRFSGTVFAIINTAGTFGGIIMPVVFGRLLDAFTTSDGTAGTLTKSTDWGPLFLVLSAMYLGSGLCWLLIDCTRPVDHDEQEQ
jgi:sugar phosphate permease